MYYTLDQSFKGCIITFDWRSSEVDGLRYNFNSRGKTLAVATDLACSGLCRPICPRAQAVAAKMWSSLSSLSVIANWTTP